jgi:hypothetical protein
VGVFAAEKPIPENLTGEFYESKVLHRKRHSLGRRYHCIGDSRRTQLSFNRHIAWIGGLFSAVNLAEVPSRPEQHLRIPV